MRIFFGICTFIKSIKLMLAGDNHCILDNYTSVFMERECETLSTENILFPKLSNEHVSLHSVAFISSWLI
jgi:hypothetical protein